ncbi:MAG: carnitine dehydratase [Acidobacteria bacterium]|nr:MAG: carnitine dehydratase [Acidobacteriota bacterium]
MLPLEGIKIVSVEQAVAAPFASRQLADFGARVIKIERPEGGDFARDYDHKVRGMSSWFVWLNRSKQSLSLDLKRPEATEIVDKLTADCDVFIHNLAPGAADRVGLKSKAMLSRNERLVVCEISGYGSEGPYKNKKAYDLLVQFETGLVSITGTPDSPSKAGISAADIAAGVYAFSGILMALYRREKTGRGGVVQVSLFDALSEWVLPAAYYGLYGGSAPSRSGAEHASIAPYGPYFTGDGKQINIGIQNEREWRQFCALVLLNREIAADPRFDSNSQRSENRKALRSVIAEIFRTLTLEEIVERLEHAGIAHSRANSVQELLPHPQHAARGRWRNVASPVGPLQALLPSILLDGADPRMEAIPALGQDTDAILTELGYTQQQIQRFRQDGVV